MHKYLIIVRARLKRDGSDRRGMALLLTLLVTVILTVVVLEFNYLMRVHATLSGNLADELKAEATARAGVERAKALLLNDEIADAKEKLLKDSLDEDWAAEISTTTEAVAMNVVISDEMSKFNLNRLLNRAAAETERESVNMYMIENVRQLFDLLDLDPNLVYGIVDWVDQDDEEEPFGAEREHYESLEPPIRCKNGPIDSLEELLFIEGFDAELVYGEGDTPGLAEFVTICGDEEGLININTAPEEVIAAALNSESSALRVVELREVLPFKDLQDAAGRLPDINFAGKFTTGSSFFSVSSTGQVLSDGAPVRELTLNALLRVRREEGKAGRPVFTIDTLSWKAEK